MLLLVLCSIPLCCWCCVVYPYVVVGIVCDVDVGVVDVGVGVVLCGIAYNYI